MFFLNTSSFVPRWCLRIATLSNDNREKMLAFVSVRGWWTSYRPGRLRRVYLIFLDLILWEQFWPLTDFIWHTVRWGGVVPQSLQPAGVCGHRAAVLVRQIHHPSDSERHQIMPLILSAPGRMQEWRPRNVHTLMNSSAQVLTPATVQLRLIKDGENCASPGARETRLRLGKYYV